MGRKYTIQRLHLHQHSQLRKFLRLNEGEYEPHRIRPYAFSATKFHYRNMFEKKHTTRIEAKNAERSAKKTIRRELKRTIYEDDSVNNL